MTSSTPNRHMTTKKASSARYSLAAICLAVAAVSGCSKQVYNKPMALAPEPLPDKATEMRNFDQSKVIYPSGATPAGNTLFDYTTVSDDKSEVDQAWPAIPTVLGNIVMMPAAFFQNTSDKAVYVGQTIPPSSTLVPPLGKMDPESMPEVPVEEVTVIPVPTTVPATRPAVKTAPPVESMPPVKDVPTTVTPTVIPPAPAKPAPAAQPKHMHEDMDLNKDTDVPVLPPAPTPRPAAPAVAPKPVTPPPAPPAMAPKAPATRPAAPAPKPAAPTVAPMPPSTRPAAPKMAPKPVTPPAPPAVVPMPPATRPTAPAAVPTVMPPPAPATQPAAPDMNK